MNEFTIQEMKENEAIEASKLHQKCFKKYWSEKEFLEFHANPLVRTFLLKKEGILCSLLVFQMISPEVEIYTFCTHPDFRQKKIASYLMKYFQNYLIAENISDVFLEVSQINKSAQEFYKKFDFVIYDIRKDYYFEDNCYVDALLMKWKNSNL